MDLLRFGGIRRQRAGDPIVEAHTAGNQQVCFLNRVVDPRLAMHAHHAQVQFVGGGKAAQAEQGTGDWDLGPLRQRAHLFHRARMNDAVAGKDQRPLCRTDQLRSVDDALLHHMEHGVAAKLLRSRRSKIKLRCGLLRVLGDVDQDRPGTSGSGNAEGVAQHRSYVFRAGNDIVVLSHR